MRKIYFRRAVSGTNNYLVAPDRQVVDENCGYEIFRLPYSIEVYKYVKTAGTCPRPRIIKLRIPRRTLIHGATVTSYSRKWDYVSDVEDAVKFRAERAFVLGNHDPDKVWRSPLYPEFTYHRNKMVYPVRFEEELEICAGGIHFFLTIFEALAFAGREIDSDAHKSIKGF